MAGKTKKSFKTLVGAFVFFILIMTWFYPYSLFGISKSYSYTPDPFVVDGYIEDLNEFKSVYAKDLEGMGTDGTVDLTVDRTQYLLPLFEQDWLLSKEPTKWSLADLDKLLAQVKDVRTILLDLFANEAYEKDQRYYLVDSLKSSLSLEDQIVEIKSGKTASRKSLEIQFSNLHVSFLKVFMTFETFYEISQVNAT